MERSIECISRNMVLRGVVHKPDTGLSEYPAVVMYHGFCDDRNEINFVHTELARKLCDAGIACFRFDFAGSGESDGLFENVTVSGEVEDAMAMLDYVKELDWVDKKRIALHGLSLGGCVASIVAGKRKDEIAALSLCCPAPDVVYNLRDKSLCGIDVSDVEEKGYMDVEGLRLNADFYYDALQLDPYTIAADFDKNVNLVHGDEDITASCECSYRYKEIYGDRASLLIVHGAEHRFKSIEFRQARINSAVEFLKNELI